MGKINKIKENGNFRKFRFVYRSENLTKFHKYLEKFVFENMSEITETDETVKVRVISSPAFTVDTDYGGRNKFYIRGSNKPFKYRKNELVGTVYTFRKEFLIPTN